MPNETDTRRRVTYPPQGGNPEIATAVGGFTSRDLIPQDAYALPMHRNPDDPPNTNYGDPYASRRHLPRYIGFPSKYPQVLPVETPTARGIVSALIQPWLLPMPDPIRLPPAPRGGGGRANKPADPPPADDKKQENTSQTPVVTTYQRPANFTYAGVEGLSGTGHSPIQNTVDAPATDPNLNMGSGTQIGRMSGGAIAAEAVNDMLDLYLNTGRDVSWQPTIRSNMTPGQRGDDNTGVGATTFAEQQFDVDRNAYWQAYRDMFRMAQDPQYAYLLRQQRGY